LQQKYNIHHKFNKLQEQAQEFIGANAFPTNQVGNISQYISKQHFLVRFTLFSTIATSLCFLAYYIATELETKFQCNNLNYSILPMCKMLIQVRMAVSANYEKFLNIIFYQIMGGILVISSWFSGLLN